MKNPRINRIAVTLLTSSVILILLASSLVEEVPEGPIKIVDSAVRVDYRTPGSTRYLLDVWVNGTWKPLRCPVVDENRCNFVFEKKWLLPEPRVSVRLMTGGPYRITYRRTKTAVLVYKIVSVPTNEILFISQENP